MVYAMPTRIVYIIDVFGKSEFRLSGGWGDLVLLTERQDDFSRAIARGVTDYT